MPLEIHTYAHDIIKQHYYNISRFNCCDMTSLYLQETDDHEDETVGADAPGEDFVQIPLQQKLLQHEDQVRQHWILLKAKCRDRCGMKMPDSNYRLSKKTPERSILRVNADKNKLTWAPAT